ncbi:NAD-dependent epimerase/dehydratase family protein [Enterococcus faecium]
MYLEKELDQLKEKGLYNTIDILESENGACIIVDGKKMINLASNNYLGFANREELKKACIEATEVNALEVAREFQLKFFTPSSIGAFGPNTPKDHTPQDTLQRPTTMYGVTKVAGELLCDYYYVKYGVDTRGVRFPGLISYATLPGGGTTDYAVDIYYSAIKEGKYTSFIDQGTSMDMMYMPDAIDAIIKLMNADPDRLVHRNAFNISAMSFDPEEIKASIQKIIPDFEMDYDVDPVRQSIAESWPNSLDVSCAQEEWGFSPKYDLDAMTKDMLEKLKEKLVETV